MREALHLILRLEERFFSTLAQISDESELQGYVQGIGKDLDEEEFFIDVNISLSRWESDSNPKVFKNIMQGVYRLPLSEDYRWDILIRLI